MHAAVLLPAAALCFCLAVASALHLCARCRTVAAQDLAARRAASQANSAHVVSQKCTTTNCRERKRNNFVYFSGVQRTHLALLLIIVSFSSWPYNSLHCKVSSSIRSMLPSFCFASLSDFTFVYICRALFSLPHCLSLLSDSLPYLSLRPRSYTCQPARPAAHVGPGRPAVVFKK
jgi:hypothetical protein